MTPEYLPDRLRQRLRAIDNEQPAHRRVQTPPDQVIQQRPNRRGVLRRALDHAQRMFDPLGIDPDRGDQHQLLFYMDTTRLRGCRL